MATDLLEIQPHELRMTLEVKKQSSCSIQLGNRSDQYVAFKVKTTHPKRYCVRPNRGVVKPKTTCDFTVTMQAQKVAPPDLQCEDKFLVQSIIVPFGATEEDITSDLFAKDSGKYIEEKKLKVVLVSSPRSPVLLPNNGVVVMMPNELLEIQPHELKIAFEVKKQCSCSIQLRNVSDQYVAFKVNTTSPKKYCVRPNKGVIKPKTTCDFTVTMQAQKVAPPDLQCRDKFLVQSINVPIGATKEDITSDLFTKDSGKYIEEKKLKVVLVSPPRSPVLLPNSGVVVMMPKELLEIQPHELKIAFEVKKRYSWSIQLGNVSDQYVAFKVSTTSPEKYCVQPNRGVIKPKATCDFNVTMQAQKVAPPDLQCKDKFLVQSIIVPFGATEEDITSDLFTKVSGKYIEEKKLKVALVSPPQSPVMLPSNGVHWSILFQQGIWTGHDISYKFSFLKKKFSFLSKLKSFLTMQKNQDDLADLQTSLLTPQ